MLVARKTVPTVAVCWRSDNGEFFFNFYFIFIFLYFYFGFFAMFYDDMEHSIF